MKAGLSVQANLKNKPTLQLDELPDRISIRAKITTLFKSGADEMDFGIILGRNHYELKLGIAPDETGQRAVALMLIDDDRPPFAIQISLRISDCRTSLQKRLGRLTILPAHFGLLVLFGLGFLTAFLRSLVFFQMRTRFFRTIQFFILVAAVLLRADAGTQAFG